MAFAFIKNLAGLKASGVVQAGVEAYVRWDPKGSTAAELLTMEQHLDVLNQQVSEARQAFNKERQEAVAIVALHNQRLAAAELLQKQIDAATDPAVKAELEKSLGTQLTLIERMAPDVEREQAEAADAKDVLETLDASFQEAGQKLLEGRAQLEQAERDMKRAVTQRESAERQAEAARRAAGLTQVTSGLTVALKAMQDAAAKDLVSADAAANKAKLLRQTKPEQDDPHIAAAMAAVSGKPVAATSLAGRLAALKERAA